MDAKMVEGNLAQFKNALKKFIIFGKFTKKTEKELTEYFENIRKEFRHSTCI